MQTQTYAAAPAALPRRVGRGLAAVVAAAGTAIAGVLGLAGPASAHVTVQPGTVEGGGFAVVAFRVPDERDDASTTRVRVLLPKAQPIGSVSTTPLPGWTATTRTRALDRPIRVEGERLGRVVSQVTWTAIGIGIGPGQFEDFALDLGPLPDSGRLVFTALQRYSDGRQVAWNEVAVGGGAEPEHPAPVLTLTAPAAAVPTSTAGASAPGSRDSGSRDSGSSDHTGTLSVVLSLVALVLSAAALLLALTTAARTRRRRP